jgi:hypothetical protein
MVGSMRCNVARIVLVVLWSGVQANSPPPLPPSHPLEVIPCHTCSNIKIDAVTGEATLGCGRCLRVLYFPNSAGSAPLCSSVFQSWHPTCSGPGYDDANDPAIGMRPMRMGDRCRRGGPDLTQVSTPMSDVHCGTSDLHPSSSTELTGINPDADESYLVSGCVATGVPYAFWNERFEWLPCTGPVVLPPPPAPAEPPSPISPPLPPLEPQPKQPPTPPTPPESPPQPPASPPAVRDDVDAVFKYVFDADSCVEDGFYVDLLHPTNESRFIDNGDASRCERSGTGTAGVYHGSECAWWRDKRGYEASGNGLPNGDPSVVFQSWQDMQQQSHLSWTVPSSRRLQTAVDSPPSSPPVSPPPPSPSPLPPPAPREPNGPDTCDAREHHARSRQGWGDPDYGKGLNHTISVEVWHPLECVPACPRVLARVPIQR